MIESDCDAMFKFSINGRLASRLTTQQAMLKLKNKNEL